MLTGGTGNDTLDGGEGNDLLIGDSSQSESSNNSLDKWLKEFGTTGLDVVKDIALSKGGSVYAVGTTNGVFDSNRSLGGTDAFIAKYRSDGTQEWIKSFGSNADDQALTVTIGKDGLIYVGGDTRGSFDGQVNQGPVNELDGYITAFDSSGVKKFTQFIGTEAPDSVSGLEVSANGSLLISGSSGGELSGQAQGNSFGGFLMNTNVTASGLQTNWTKIFGNTMATESYASAKSADGSMYMVGATNGALNGANYSGNTDAYVTKIGADGTQQWTQLISSYEFSGNGDQVNGGQEVAYAVATGADGSVYVSGYFNGKYLDGRTDEANAGAVPGYVPVSGAEPYTKDIFVSKFSSNGTKLWTKALGDTGDETGYALSVDSEGSVYVAGTAPGQPALSNKDTQTYWNQNSHVYEIVVNKDGMTWDQANSIAQSKSLNGVQGHLATITSAEENSIAYSLVAKQSDVMMYTALGGSDEGSEGNWRWVTGPERGAVMQYTNWIPGEPNNGWGPPQNVLAFATGEAKQPGKWDDGWRDPGIVGQPKFTALIIEYSANNGEMKGKDLQDVYFAKLSASGDLRWERNLSSTSQTEAGLALQTTAGGAVYLAGGGVADLPGNTSAGGGDAFIYKFANNPGQKDVLIGGAGNDTLIGGLESDMLTGGDGKDVFIFNTAVANNIDTILDFVTGTDKIQLSKSIFTNAGATGNLTNNAFWSAAGAVTGHDTDDRVVYNSTTGALYYDADGNGSGAAVQIAILGTSSHPTTAYTDFAVIV